MSTGLAGRGIGVGDVGCDDLGDTAASPKAEVAENLLSQVT